MKGSIFIIFNEMSLTLLCVKYIKNFNNINFWDSEPSYIFVCLFNSTHLIKMKRGIIGTLKYIHLVKDNTCWGQRAQEKFIFLCFPFPFSPSNTHKSHLLKKKTKIQKVFIEHVLCDRHCSKCLEYIRVFMNEAYKWKLF